MSIFAWMAKRKGRRYLLQQLIPAALPKPGRWSVPGCIPTPERGNEVASPIS